MVLPVAKGSKECSKITHKTPNLPKTDEGLYMSRYRLTEYSHGAGCGCKIAPDVLDTILKNTATEFVDSRLLVGAESRDDAAVFDLGNGQAVISTTDFFMPIVDDPVDFGRVAATNAISDIYAMGGVPIMAIAILGWPLDSLPAEIASLVIDGGRQVCREAGIMLAGGHSIDAPEPIFGLAVTGLTSSEHVVRNNSANVGNELYLSKPLGIGILTTAEKKKKLVSEHKQIARDCMCQLNAIGAELAQIGGVTAMTDVTGFGFLGHLCEMCEGSGVSAQIDFDSVPLLTGTKEYLRAGCTPGGTQRNFESYGHKIGPMTDIQRQILCDPQTSGGLLIAVETTAAQQVFDVVSSSDQTLSRVGTLLESQSPLISICN